jgi:hypothetical protein
MVLVSQIVTIQNIKTQPQIYVYLVIYRDVINVHQNKVVSLVYLDLF